MGSNGYGSTSVFVVGLRESLLVGHGRLKLDRLQYVGRGAAAAIQSRGLGSEPLFEAFAELEDFCRQLLEDEHPTVQALWSSSIKPSGRYPAILKAKINTSEPRQAKFFDATNQPTEAPASWKNVQINAVIHVRGVYIQKNTIGLSLETTHILYGPPPPPPPPFDYFAK